MKDLDHTQPSPNMHSILQSLFFEEMLLSIFRKKYIFWIHPVFCKYLEWLLNTEYRSVSVCAWQLTLAQTFLLLLLYDCVCDCECTVMCVLCTISLWLEKYIFFGTWPVFWYFLLGWLAFQKQQMYTKQYF